MPDTMAITGVNSRTATAQADCIEVDVRGPGEGNAARLTMTLQVAEALIEALLDQRAEAHRLRSEHGDAPGMAVLTKSPEPLQNLEVSLMDQNTALIRVRIGKSSTMAATAKATDLEPIRHRFELAIRARDRLRKGKRN